MTYSICWSKDSAWRLLHSAKLHFGSDCEAHYVELLGTRSPHDLWEPMTPEVYPSYWDPVNSISSARGLVTLSF
jgi:hypothetical protein